MNGSIKCHWTSRVAVVCAFLCCCYMGRKDFAWVSECIWCVNKWFWLLLAYSLSASISATEKFESDTKDDEENSLPGNVFAHACKIRWLCFYGCVLLFRIRQCVKMSCRLPVSLSEASNIVWKSTAVFFSTEYPVNENKSHGFYKNSKNIYWIVFFFILLNFDDWGKLHLKLAAIQFNLFKFYYLCTFVLSKCT